MIQPAFKKQLAVIMGFSMDPVIAKVIQSGVSYADAVIQIRELKRFLFICANHLEDGGNHGAFPGEPEHEAFPLMSVQVDLAWQETIANKTLYRQLCRLLGIRYLYRYEEDMEPWPTWYEHLRHIYGHYFPGMPAEIWPEDEYKAKEISRCRLISPSKLKRQKKWEYHGTFVW